MGHILLATNNAKKLAELRRIVAEAAPEIDVVGLADVAAYRLLQRRLGTDRAVVVTPSTYGTDNRCTLDAVATLGDAARAVVVVTPAATPACCRSTAPAAP